MQDIISRKVAKEEGLIKYFTGKSCKHGHISERYTKYGSCLECIKVDRVLNGAERKRNYYKRNKDRVLKQNKSWNDKNNFHKTHRQQNREYYAKLSRKYYKNNQQEPSDNFF